MAATRISGVLAERIDESGKDAKEAALNASRTVSDTTRQAEYADAGQRWLPSTHLLNRQPQGQRSCWF